MTTKCDYFITSDFVTCNEPAKFVTLSIMKDSDDPIKDYSCLKHHEERIKTFNIRNHFDGRYIIPISLDKDEWFSFDYKNGPGQIAYILIKMIS